MAKTDPVLLLASCKNSHKSHYDIIDNIESTKDRISVSQVSVDIGKKHYCLAVSIKTKNPNKVRSVLYKVRRQSKISEAFKFA